MEERRKYRRMELASHLVIKNLNGTEKEVPIEVVNVSKTGIGFICENELNSNTIYEAYLTIWMKENIHAFRREKVQLWSYFYRDVGDGFHADRSL